MMPYSARVLLFASVAVASLGACSTTTTQITTQRDVDSGAADPNEIEAVDAGVSVDASMEAGTTTDAGGTATNPYGVPYPTKNLGFTPRQGTKPGLVIPNLKFAGTKPEETVMHPLDLAAVFDPLGKTHDIVAILGVSLWDTFSRKMMNDLGAPPPRVVVLSVLGEGVTPGSVATSANFGTWRTLFPWAWNALDPGFTQLSPLFDAAAVPLVSVLDARTMEIVSAGVGASQSIKQDLLAAAEAVRDRPPAY
jgi:hypothetical protein